MMMKKKRKRIMRVFDPHPRNRKVFGLRYAGLTYQEQMKIDTKIREEDRIEEIKLAETVVPDYIFREYKQRARYVYSKCELKRIEEEKSLKEYTRVPNYEYDGHEGWSSNGRPD